MRPILVDSLDAPELEPYRTLRRPTAHRQAGIFVAEGEKVVLRLVDSGLPVGSVLVSPERLERHRETFERLGDATPLFVAPRSRLEEIVGFSLHQGILALGQVPPPPDLDLRLGTLVVPPLVVALDGIVGAENVGVIVRNAAALGAHALVSGGGTASPWLRRAVRNSMGSIFGLPILETDDLVGELERLRDRHRLACWAAVPSGAPPMETIDLAGGTLLVFGSEGDGVSAAVRATCDGVTIPMSPGVDSLNVAAASAVLLAEAARQRRSAARPSSAGGSV